MVRRINLVPPSERQRKKTDLGLVGIVAGSLLVLGAIGLSYFYFTGVAGDKEAELADLQMQRQQIEAEIALLAEYEALQLEVVRTEQLVQQVYAGRTLVSEVFGDMSLVVPDNVWLDSLALQAPEIPLTVAAAPQDTAADPAAPPTAPTAPPVAWAPGTVTIAGKTFDYDDVATMLVRLQQIPSLKNVSLAQANADGEDDEGLKTFSITAELVNKTQPADNPLPLTAVEVSN